MTIVRSKHTRFGSFDLWGTVTYDLNRRPDVSFDKKSGYLNLATLFKGVTNNHTIRTVVVIFRWLEICVFGTGHIRWRRTHREASFCHISALFAISIFGYLLRPRSLQRQSLVFCKLQPFLAVMNVGAPKTIADVRTRDIPLESSRFVKSEAGHESRITNFKSM